MLGEDRMEYSVTNYSSLFKLFQLVSFKAMIMRIWGYVIKLCCLYTFSRPGTAWGNEYLRYAVLLLISGLLLFDVYKDVKKFMQKRQKP